MTLRDTLDIFIFQLANDVETSFSDHPIYRYLHSLVYGEGEISPPPVPLSPPFYPHLVTAYHLLFVKGKRDRAEVLFDVVKETYTSTRGARFGYDEEKLLELLDKVFSFTISKYSAERCETLKLAVGRIVVEHSSWASFFKDLVLVRLGKLDVGMAKRRFEEYVDELTGEIDEDVAEHFNIPSTPMVYSAVLDYIGAEIRRLERELNAGFFGKLNRKRDNCEKLFKRE